MQPRQRTCWAAFAAALIGFAGCGGETGPGNEPTTGWVHVACVPDTLAAGWSLQGPGDLLATGNGDSLVAALEPGAYTLAWTAVPRWRSPSPAILTGTLTAGDTLRLTGRYEPILTATLRIAFDPPALPASWSLAREGLPAASGQGAAVLADLAPGDYALDFAEPVGWAGEGPAQRQFALAAAETTLVTRRYVRLWASLALAVGDEGVILRSTDGGRTWQPVGSGTPRRLNDVALPAVGQAVAVGDRGIVLISRDGGLTWQEQQITTRRLMGVAFSTALRGMAVGEAGAAQFTADGGVTWQQRDLPLPAHQRSVATAGPVRFVSVGPRYAAEAGPLFAFTTDDAGATWTPGVVAANANDLHAVAMTASGWGLAVGKRATILRTVNGGVNYYNDFTADFPELRAVAISPAGGAVAVGAATDTTRALVLKSHGAGAPWVYIASGTPASLNDVIYLSEQELLAIGDDGTMLRSQDGGATWQPLAVLTESDLRGAAFVLNP